jgi:hypothetical protein
LYIISVALLTLWCSITSLHKRLNQINALGQCFSYHVPLNTGILRIHLSKARLHSEQQWIFRKQWENGLILLNKLIFQNVLPLFSFVCCSKTALICIPSVSVVIIVGFSFCHWFLRWKSFQKIYSKGLICVLQSKLCISSFIYMPQCYSPNYNFVYCDVIMSTQSQYFL